jgi:hypothetical protein
MEYNCAIRYTFPPTLLHFPFFDPTRHYFPHLFLRRNFAKLQRTQGRTIHLLFPRSTQLVVYATFYIKDKDWQQENKIPPAPKGEVGQLPANQELAIPPLGG